MNRLHKLLVAVVMATSLSLGGCADFRKAWDVVTTATITPKQAYVAANGFNVLEATATNYLRLPLCGKIPCRTVAATNAIVPLVRSGRVARDKLEDAVNVNPDGPVDANLFNTLITSSDQLKQVIAIYSIGAK